MLDKSVAENTALASLDKYIKFGLISDGRMKAEAESENAKLRTKTPSINQALKNLSGGNQQNAIIARELDRSHRLLIAVQPTRGLDVGAIEFVHEQIVRSRDEGAGVLLVSLELDEVMNVSDRILVMYEGEIVGELDPKKTDVRELGLYMSGAKRDATRKETVKNA